MNETILLEISFFFFHLLKWWWIAWLILFLPFFRVSSDDKCITNSMVTIETIGFYFKHDPSFDDCLLGDRIMIHPKVLLAWFDPIHDSEKCLVFEKKTFRGSWTSSANHIHPTDVSIEKSPPLPSSHPSCSIHYQSLILSSGSSRVLDFYG